MLFCVACRVQCDQVVLGVVALTTTLALPARAAEAPQMPAPSPEMGQVAYFVGSWSCTGKAETTPLGPAHATQADVHVRKEFNDFWDIGHYVEKKTAENPHPMSFAFVMGYDTAAKALTLDGYDAFGGRSHQTASGWKDGKLVFDGQNLGTDGQSTPARDTFTKKSETTMEHLGEMQFGGQWTRIDAETCTRGK